MVKSIVAMAFASIERLFVTEKATVRTISMRGKFRTSIAYQQFLRYFGNGNFPLEKHFRFRFSNRHLIIAIIRDW